MSHHFDSPAALADGRSNACDLYVFLAADPFTGDAAALSRFLQGLSEGA
jgi:hypothetical protein